MFAPPCFVRLNFLLQVEEGLHAVSYTHLGRKIPLYYGSSFAYLTAISSMVAAEGTAEQIAQVEASGILPAALISQAQFGIVLSGLVSIAAGLIVRFCGRRAVEKILPASITGPVDVYKRQP